MVVERLNYNYDFSGIGDIEIPYEKLVKLFGFPTNTENNKKIRIFWAFKIGDFKFSIHDYEQFERKPSTIVTWAVGSYKSNNNISFEMKRIYIGGLLSGKKIIEQGMVDTAFNLYKLNDYFSPRHKILYSYIFDSE